MSERPTADVLPAFVPAPAAARPPRVGDLRVVGTGYLPAQRQRHARRFDVWAVGFVASGRGDYRAGDGPARAVGPGCAFAVWPGPAFDYGPAAGTAWEEYFVIVEGPGVRRWAEAGWLFTDGSVRPVARAGEVVGRFRELRRTLARGGEGDSDRALSMAERLLIEVEFGRCEAGGAEVLASAASVEAVLDHCRRHLSRPVDFEALADAAAMSYSHLRQRVKAVTGFGPAAYLARLRCAAACDLLSDTDLSVKQVAVRVGVSDPYTFSRAFRRVVGVGPLAYRRRVAPWASRGASRGAAGRVG